MDIISFCDNELRLNSGILEENFGKMSFASIITEKGLIVKVTHKENEYSFDYSPWTFGGVQSFDSEGGRKVFFCGESPFKTQPSTLLDVLENKELSFKAGLTIIRILTDAALNNKDIPLTGAGGILIETEGDTFTALFLPESLFTNAVAGKDTAEKARQINLWQNPTLHGYQALRFARSVIAYKILTGTHPFPAEDTIERNADILDKKYLPLELCVQDIDENLAAKINTELELNSATVYIPGKGKKKKAQPKKNAAVKLAKTFDASNLVDEKKTLPGESDAQKAKRLQGEYQKAVCAFPFELLEKTEELKDKVSNEDLKKKAADYISARTKFINAKRKIRRNTSIIISSIVGALVLFIIIFNSAKTKETNLVSKGLTAEQTVEAFYQSFNKLDTQFVYDHAKGKTTKPYSDVVSQMYVIGKNRTAYTNDHGIQKPAAYFLTLIKESDIVKGGLYGITHLSINGKPKAMDVKIPMKKNNLPAITSDKGIEVYDKMNSVQEAHYYLLHTEDTTLYVEEITDILTLTFIKDRWIITDIKTDSKFLKVNSSKFFETYFDIMDMTDRDPQAAVRIMSNNFEWLPEKKDFELELASQAAEDMELKMMFGQVPAEN